MYLEIEKFIVFRVLGHFLERHVVERHFIERHFIERHFIDGHFIEGKQKVSNKSPLSMEKMLCL